MPPKPVIHTNAYPPPKKKKLKGAHAPAVDWWSFGCVVYEMLSGSLPFGDSADLTKYEIYTNITEKKLRFGKGFRSKSKKLLRRLLDKNPETRLGWEGVQVLVVHTRLRGPPPVVHTASAALAFLRFVVSIPSLSGSSQPNNLLQSGAGLFCCACETACVLDPTTFPVFPGTGRRYGCRISEQSEPNLCKHPSPPTPSDAHSPNKEHAWFRNVDWVALHKRRIFPPWVPSGMKPGCTECFLQWKPEPPAGAGEAGGAAAAGGGGGGEHGYPPSDQAQEYSRIVVPRGCALRPPPPPQPPATGEQTFAAGYCWFRLVVGERERQKREIEKGVSGGGAQTCVHFRIEGLNSLGFKPKVWGSVCSEVCDEIDIWSRGVCIVGRPMPFRGRSEGPRGLNRGREQVGGGTSNDW